MVLIVSAIAERLDPPILAARVVVPNGADRNVAAGLDDLIVNVVPLAAVAGSFLGDEMDHIVVALQKIDRAVDVEDVHPTPRVDAPVPAPDIGIAADLLLCADDRPRAYEGDCCPEWGVIDLVSGWLSTY